MAKPKSIIEKFSETVKGLAESASQVLKAEEPARVDETAAASMPYTAEGLVSDPLLVPPIATPPSRRKKRAPGSTTRGGGASAGNKSAPKKSSRKAAIISPGVHSANSGPAGKFHA